MILHNCVVGVDGVGGTIAFPDIDDERARIKTCPYCQRAVPWSALRPVDLSPHPASFHASMALPGEPNTPSQPSPTPVGAFTVVEDGAD